jgi:uncharacterized protein
MRFFLLALLLLAVSATTQPVRADLNLNPLSAFWDNIARAAQQNDAQQVQSLVTGNDANPNQTDGTGRTGLHYAAMNGNMQIAAILIRAGAKLDVRDPLGDTPLHWAVERDHADLARLLLDAGAPVDADNKDGLTPLMFAARDGHLELVRLLLERGADAAKTDYTGRDALGWAEDGRAPAVVQALKRAVAGRDQ